MRTTNPVLNDKVFQPQNMWWEKDAAAKPQTMTLQGSVVKTGILLGICSVFAVVSWSWLGTNAGQAMAAVMGAGIIGLILCLVISFKPTTAAFLAPVYAGVEGLFVGGVSSWYAARFGDQIVLQAGLLTFGILAALLVAYTSRLIKATENFKLGVVAATGGVFLLCMASLVLSLFGINIPYVWDSGPIGIGVAAVIVVIAALNLVLDFDFIEAGSSQGAPKHMEWYAAFGLLVTLVWLYMSILRLLAAIQRD